MTESPQPTSGSLEARLIRACKIHNNKCKLTCPQRAVEDLGEIARFTTPLADQDTAPTERGKRKWLRWFQP